MKISFVIPCYRSERSIEGVVDEIRDVMSRRPSFEYEVVLVSDHSPDAVYAVIERMCAHDPEHLSGIELARNFGQPSALMAGFSKVSGGIIVCLDDDGQTPVDETFSLVDKLEEGKYDVVYGAYPNKRHNLFRNIGSEINHWMAIWLIGKPRGIRTTSFFAARRFVVEEMRNYRGPYPYIGGIIFRTTRNIATAPVRHRCRVEGRSGYTLAKLLGLILNGFTAFSVKPLRVASFAGAFCSFLGFCYGVWTIVKKFFVCPSMPVGYSSLMSVLLFVGGGIMLMLGLIGEYVGRIYICLNGSPQYVISRETESSK